MLKPQRCSVLIIWQDFFVELSQLLSNGIPLTTALSSLAQQRIFRKVHAFIEHSLSLIGQGQPFSQAFLQPATRTWHAFIVAGELSGELDLTLHHLARFIQERLQWQQQLNAALSYPLILLVVFIAGIILLLGWITPAFYQLYHQFQAPTPASLEVLFKTSLWLRHYWLWLVGIFIALILLLWVALHHSRVLQYAIERQLLRLPLLRQHLYATEAQQLSILLSAGVPLLSALAHLVTHTQWQSQHLVFCRVLEQIVQGKSLHQAYRLAGWHEAHFCDKLALAEQTGLLGDTYQQLAGYYQRKLQQHMARFKQTAQPVLLLLMGSLIGIWVLLLYYPLIQLGYAMG